MNPISAALKETAAVIRSEGGFNDKAVDLAFARMADKLEKRAECIEADASPAVIPEATPTPASKPTKQPAPKPEVAPVKE